jgi:hypothetical protein
MPEAFTDPKKVTKSYVPSANAPIDVSEGQSMINELIARLKRDRSIGSKENPRKRKGAKNIDDQVENNQEKLVALEEPSPEEILSPVEISPEENIVVPEETKVPEICENYEISINCYE